MQGDNPGKPVPVYAKKSDKKRKEQIRAQLNEEAFRSLFGGDAAMEEVVQITFDDAVSGTQKNENAITIRPREYVKTADRISDNIARDFSKGDVEYRTKKKTAAGPVTLVTRVSFDLHSLDIKEGNGFSSLDKEVHDAIVSLYAAGNKVFSPAMIYRTMTGKSDSSFVAREKLQSVSASIYKCMSSIITIDASEEASAYGLEALYSQNLIYAKAVTLRTKGWEVSAFLLLDEPVLYKYAKLKRQLFSVPLKVLDTPPNKTDSIIVLQGYLLRVVEGLRQPGSRQSNVIVYSEIYELLGCVGAAKQKLQRLRNSLKAILDYWVDIGYIGGYLEITQGRSKHSVELKIEQKRFLIPE